MASKKNTARANDFFLYRSETNRVLGGVCGGLAEALNVEPNIIRILFLITFLFGGASLLFYFILWIVVPTKSKVNKTTNETITDNIDEVKMKAQEFKEQLVDAHDEHSGRRMTGVIIIGLGILFLLNNFGYGRYFLNMGRLWPLFLVAIGFAILSKKGR